MSETITLITQAQQGDRTATERLVTENTGLIWSIARRYFGRGVEPDDLFQLGCVGFLKAVEGFDTAYGTQFSTYAVPKIAGEIRRFLRDDGAVKVSRSIKERAAAIKKTRERLTGDFGREPTVSELSEAMGLSPEEIASAETATSAAESIQRQTGEEGFSLEDVLCTDGMEEKLLEKLALREALRHLGEKDGITLRIYTRQLTPAEEKRIIQNAANKNRMGSSNTNDLQQTITAESNLQDVASLVASMHRNREPLLHCAVYIELTASDYNTLKLLQTDVLTELVRSKLNVDRLLLRQQQGFCCASPVGYNAFGQQFERVLPASSVANLYPFNYSGKTDAKGFYVGRDKYGSNILVDFDQRDEDKTSANILILGNSGQGKSYLMKLLILNLLESGKSVITLDAEHEQQEMCEAVGGCFADLMAGKYIINVLEPKCWDDGGDPDDTAAPEAFRKSTLLAQHVSFLKDFFRAYKDFSDAHIDTIEIMVSKLYAKWGITERSNFRRMRPEDYPILSDLYDLIEEEFKRYDPNAHLLYTEKLLQEVLLGLHSMCKGADAQFFNGPTNITSSRFLVFGVKGMLSAAKNVRNAMLFNVLSFMSDKLLTVGNTVAALDELYIWLSNPTAIEYIRNCLKRVRKKESAMLLASQNLEDFDQEGIREMTKPLFSIPPHQFLFNAGSIDKRSYMEMLQLDEAEYNLIKFPQRGVCLYKCGNERYLLEVHAPSYKEKLFGTAGGR